MSNNSNENMETKTIDENSKNLPTDLEQVKDLDKLDYYLNLTQYTVYKRYLPDLCKYPVAEPEESFLMQNPEKCARFYKLNKLVYKQGEDNLQKLSTVYYASMALGCSLIIMLDQKSNSPVDIYIGVKNDGKDLDKLNTSSKTLRKEIKSNFPGSELEIMDAESKMQPIVDEIFSEEVVQSISTVSCVAALRDKSKTENKSFIQGIERFIDAMHGEPYTAMFIAEPVSNEELADIRDGYEGLYSSLSTFQKSTLSYGINESHSVMKGINESISNTVTKSISKTQSHTVTKGGNLGINIGGSIGKATTSPTGVGRAGSALSALGSALSGAASLIPLAADAASAACPPLGIALAIGGGLTSILGSGMQGSSVGKSIGGMLGLNAGVHKDKADTNSETNQESEGKTIQKGSQEADTDTSGTSQTIQFERVNKHIEEILNRIDVQLKRTQECEDYGAYNCAAYFLSSDASVSLLAANTYRALMIGEGSSVESSAINNWNYTKGDNNPVRTMNEYLKRFSHPILGMPYGELSDMTLQFVELSAGTVISGLELPLHMGLPTKSVYGVPVVQHAEFGRSVNTMAQNTNTDKIKIGRIYHMGSVESGEVKLDKKSLASHTFVTGSTGSGKSNTVYKLLSEFTTPSVNTKNDDEIKFLVVEPAKGEYKEFLRTKDVKVYGLLPNREDSELLKINPFSFPADPKRGIHILEHLDRITELFNVCWPMYAAMPAILKEAIQKAYEKCGWDINLSINRYGYPLFPDFSDVECEIRKVLEKSEYSADNKSDYIGSLVTRIHSLTTGMFGMIFSGRELSDEALFENNTIIDLSRSGASETKALIMGILVLKLQEYRMSSAVDSDVNLKHITVLEEAHHLLKRSAVGQSEEGNNLQGKAVEMLTNAIAEMRTYGEGFVIADQAPGLLDPAVIRNTNTKIIMRLPDYSDCELVGKAIGLNEYQIDEISGLKQGVAIIRQNEWLEPVLCKIDEYHKIKNEVSVPINDTKQCNKEIEKILFEHITEKRAIDDIISIKDQIMDSDLKTSLKCTILDYIDAELEKAQIYYSRFVYEFLNAQEAIDSCNCLNNKENQIFNILISLKYPIKNCNYQLKQKILLLIFKEYFIRNGKTNEVIDQFIRDKE